MRVARRGVGGLALKAICTAPFLVAGVFHLVAPAAFQRIMPPYLPWHRPWSA